MITTATLLAALMCWGLGWIGLALIERVTSSGSSGVPQASRTEQHALAVLLGITLWVFVLTALGHVTALAVLPAWLAWGLGAACAIVGTRCALRARGRQPKIDLPDRCRPLDRVAVGVALGFLGFAVVYASTMPVHIFDPVFHFAFKGKLLWHEGLLGPGWTDVEGPIGRVITHPDYPPGVGALECLLAWPSGGLAIHAARPLFALFVLATAGFLWGRLRRVGSGPAALGLLVWSSLPFLFYSRLPHPDWLKGTYGLLFGTEAGQARFGDGPLEDGTPGRWTQPDGWTLDGAGDLPLAALFSVGAWLLFAALAGRVRRDTEAAPEGQVEADAQQERTARHNALLGGLLLGGGALMKNEGLALLPVAMVAAGLAWLVTRGRPPLRQTAARAGLALGAALVVASPWLIARGAVPTIGEDYPSRLSPSGLAAAWNAEQETGFGPDGRPERAPIPAIVASGFQDAVTHIPRFGLLWLAAFTALVLRARRLVAPRAPTPWTAAGWTLLGAFALYALVLFVTPWNLTALFRTAIPDRLIFHVAPLAILLIAAAFAPSEER